MPQTWFYYKGILVALRCDFTPILGKDPGGGTLTNDFLVSKLRFEFSGQSRS